MAEPTHSAGIAGSGTAPEEHLAYRPISLLAIVGLSIAAVYAAVVLVGFAASVLFGTPWLMPTWTILVPLLAVVVSFAARLRIQRSEGTLAGLKLTGWGMALSLLFGLIYITHSAATYLVLRQQADAFARQWLTNLKNGNLESALLQTLPPANRPADSPHVASDLNIRFNQPGEGSRKGFLSEFLQRDVVRLIAQGGDQTEFKLLSVGDWDYAEGGYQVRLLYRIKTPEANMDLAVPLHGSKSGSKDQPGRQWQVLYRQVEPKRLELTDEGKRLVALWGQSQVQLDGWLKSLQAGQLENAFLATREPGERKQLFDAFQARSQAMWVALLGSVAEGGWNGWTGGLAPFLAQRDLCLPGYTEFTQGDLLLADGGKFWPTGAKQAEVYQEVRKLFQQPEGLPRSLEREPVRMARWAKDKDRLRILNDVHLNNVAGKYQVEGFVVLECDANAQPSGGRPVEWRVAGLELARAREGGGGPPGRPVPRPPGP